VACDPREVATLLLLLQPLWERTMTHTPSSSQYGAQT
jgi:hypothetical protein